jgi:hypothetical protein
MEDASFAAKISPTTAIAALWLNISKKKWGNVEIEHL